jgi:hypothetical protein
MALRKIHQPLKSEVQDAKLREAVLYLAEKCRGDETFGATKQNKLLFYCDFLAYLNFGQAITGQSYFRLGNGPAPRRWLPVSKQMIRSGDIRIDRAEYFGFTQNRTVGLRKPNLDLFSAHEIDMMDKVVEAHRGKTASEISEESHDFIGWQLASNEETIPYPVALVSTRQLRQEELKHGATLESIAAAALKADASALKDCSLRA